MKVSGASAITVKEHHYAMFDAYTQITRYSVYAPKQVTQLAHDIFSRPTVFRHHYSLLDFPAFFQQFQPKPGCRFNCTVRLLPVELAPSLIIVNWQIEFFGG